jgi:quinol monooxygenase YgiN
MAKVSKRTALTGAGALAAMAMFARPAGAATPGFGQINKLTAKPGQKAALAEILKHDMDHVPECLGYMVSEDAKEDGVFWVTEFWDSEAGHSNAMTRPGLKAAVAASRPLVSKFENVAVLRPMLESFARGA